MSNQIDPEFKEGHEVTWYEVFIVLAFFALMLYVVVAMADKIDRLSWLGYLLGGVAMVILIIRFLRRKILNK